MRSRMRPDAMAAALVALAILDIEEIDRCPVANCPLCAEAARVAA